jgi:biopolymer transport protein ExbD
VNFSPEPDEDVGINLTSLIDVVFLLLIFFMVTYSFPDFYRKKLDVRLPEARAADVSQARVKRLVLDMDAAGRMALDGQDVAPAELEARLRGRDPAVTALVVRADERVSHGRVTAVLGLARAVGITDVAIAVR